MSDPMRRAYSLVLIAAAYLYGIALYGRLQERVPRHWNLGGSADAWTGRATAVSRDNTAPRARRDHDADG